MVTSQAETQRVVTEIQVQLDQIFNLGRQSSLRRRASTASLSSVASFAASMDSKESWKQLCRDLHSIGVTADMIKAKKDQVLGLFQSSITTPVVIENVPDQAQVTPETSQGDSHSGSDGYLQLQNDIVSSVDAYLGTSGRSIEGAYEGRSTAERTHVPRINWKPLDFLVGPLLIAAAQKGDIDELRLRLTVVENINFRDPYGRTALHFAAQYGCTDIVELGRRH